MPVVCPDGAVIPSRSARRLHIMALVTPIVTIVTLLTATTPDAHFALPSLGIIVAVEHIPIPATRGPLSLRVDAYESTLVLQAPQDTALILRALSKAARIICPTADEQEGEVLLRCRSRRLSAQLVSRRGGQVLDVRELAVLPWEAVDQGPPLVPFDPSALGLGASCPGDTLVGRAECALSAGHRDEAQRLFLEAFSSSESPLAALRLGDLALTVGDVAGATRSWIQAARSSPWDTIAIQRICELDPKCLASSRFDSSRVFSGVVRALRADALLRAARQEVYRGRALEVATVLATENGPDGACAEAASFCRRVLLAALRQPGPKGAQALSLFLGMPDRDRGPYHVELSCAAADRAEEAEAPVFGANLMAVVAGDVPPAILSWHLLRTVELYLAGRDRAHARVVADFARARLGTETLRHSRWRTALRNIKSPSGSADLQSQLSGIEADLATARATLDTARSAAGGAQ